jgi:hypothetical protein
LVLAAVGSFVLFHAFGDDLREGWAAGKAAIGGLPQQPRASHRWPPVLHETYPDLRLVDQEGRRTSLCEFRGRVILIEPIGMPCRACIAFAGGHERGPFDGIRPQEDLGSIETYAREYGGVDLADERIVVVQILFYSPSMAAPTPEDARRWAAHFGLERSRNRVVLIAEDNLLGTATRGMIPGFQLVDKNFVLRYDSTGHAPRHDLYTELLPSIRGLLEQ